MSHHGGTSANTLTGLVSSSTILSQKRYVAHEQPPCDLQGKYAQTESLLLRTIVIEEKTLGPDHLEVAATRYDLACVLVVQVRVVACPPSRFLFVPRGLAEARK